MTTPNKVRLVVSGVFLLLAALILWCPVAAAVVGSLALALLLIGQMLRVFYALGDAVRRNRPNFTLHGRSKS